MRTSFPIRPSSLAIGSERPFSDLNSIFRSFFVENPAVESHGHSALRAKLTETEDAFVLKAELPGVKREDIEVNVLGDLLTIAGHFGSALENGAGDQPSTTNELRSGAFERRFQLNSPVDVSAVQASLVDGILSVQLPRAASAKPRRIEVKTEG